MSCRLVGTNEAATALRVLRWRVPSRNVSFWRESLSSRFNPRRNGLAERICAASHESRRAGGRRAYTATCLRLAKKIVRRGLATVFVSAAAAPQRLSISITATILGCFGGGCAVRAILVEASLTT